MLDVGSWVLDKANLDELGRIIAWNKTTDTFTVEFGPRNKVSNIERDRLEEATPFDPPVSYINDINEDKKSHIDEQASRKNVGKIDPTHLSGRAIMAEAAIFHYNCDENGGKYPRGNWRKLWGDQSIEVIMASTMRHTLDILDGNLYDKESGLPHAAHIRSNMAMLLEYMYKQGMVIDKPVEPVEPVE